MTPIELKRLLQSMTPRERAKLILEAQMYEAAASAELAKESTDGRD